MTRTITVAGAQLGPIARNETREEVVARLMEMMREAHGRGATLVVFPELALTSFFPRWWYEDQADIDAWFETEMPNAATQPLFDLAKALGVGFYLGYAELIRENGAARHYNTSILMDADGTPIGKYRKVHLPGHADNKSNLPFQHLEKRYFDVGDLGFPVWESFGGKMGMCICNDRRWPETYRVMALQGAEMVMLGYNTPTHIPWEPIYDHLTDFHNHLCMQSGAYQNAMWVVGVAKAGLEEGSDLIGGSCIVAPSGEIVAMAATKGDEVITAACDLDLSRHNREAMFNFAEHRRTEHYGIITSRTGEGPPVVSN